MFIHPFAQPLLYRPQVIHAVHQQRRGNHGAIGTGHQHLQHVLGRVDATGAGQISANLTVQNREPPQRQPQRLRGAQQHTRLHFEIVEVEVGPVS